MTPLEAYIKDISRHPLLKRDETLATARQAKAGDKRAFDKLVSSNLRLVVSIAKRYAKKADGIEMIDLISEGNIGLIRAAEKFDPDRGNAFTTYATWWIRQAVLRCLTNKSRTIRLPAHVVGINSRRDALVKEHQKKFGFTPSEDDLAEMMGISDKMHEATKMKQRLVSLEYSPVKHSGSNDGSQDPLRNKLPDDETPTPFEAFASSELQDIIRDCLKELSPKEESIIRLRFGITEDPSDHSRYPITVEKLEEIKALREKS